MNNIISHIICGSVMLNIIGNTIKLTFNIKSKYVIWILLIISISISFLFFGCNYDSLYIGLVTFSFSISSYDLVKCFNKIIRKSWFVLTYWKVV